MHITLFTSRTKGLKPQLSNLQMEEKVLVAGLIDDLTTMNHIEILFSINITKVTKLITSFGFVINPTKSIFVPTQDITLTPKKKQAIVDLWDTIISNPIKNIVVIFGKSSSSFVAFAPGKRFCRHLGRFKTKAQTKAFGNFDMIVEIPNQPLQEMLWWKLNKFLWPSYKAKPISNYQHQWFIIRLCSIQWGKQVSGQLFEEEHFMHIYNLELQVVQIGLKTLCHDIHRTRVLIKTDNTSAVAAVNKMGSIMSIGIDFGLQATWDWTIVLHN